MTAKQRSSSGQAAGSKLRTAKPAPPLKLAARASRSQPRGRHEIASHSLLSRAVSVDAETLEHALAPMRMTERNKAAAYDVLVRGMTQAEVAARDGKSRELVSSVVRRVRSRLAESVNAWSFVSVQLTLPLTLAEEMRGLADAISKMDDRAAAEELLHEVLLACAVAKASALRRG
jgi:hypothetical protein